MDTTRKSLVDSARKFFGCVGLKDTTMNYIALNSKKGRRTLYTYFKNKNELLNAVIEEELQCIINSLDNVMKKNFPPLNKIIDYIIIRLHSIKTSVLRNGTLQAEFFKNVVQVALVRRRFEKIEINNISILLQDGVNTEVFEIKCIKQTATFIYFLIIGLEVPYIRGMFSKNDRKQDAIIENNIS